MRFKLTHLTTLAFLLVCVFAVSAQSQLAATLEVLSAGVSVRRVNTQEFISVTKEAIVGVGDSIRTDATGRARITFFKDGVDTELLPNTEYHITQFEGKDSTFNITAEVVIGQTIQQLKRLLDSNSSYTISTDGMTLAARGTQFAVRVEESGRAAMLTTEGTVDAASGDQSASVPSGFGIRGDRDTGLSDVVRASTFEELDAAIDGCGAVLNLSDDVSLNVRSALSRNAPLLGYLVPQDVTRVFGKNKSATWYRVAFADGYGWVSVASVTINKDCAGLREFADDFSEDGDASHTPNSSDS